MKKDNGNSVATNAPHDRELDRVRRLIEALMDNDLSVETRRELRAWLASDASAEEKEEVLAEILQSDLLDALRSDRVNPSEDEVRGFAELAASLGLEVPVAKAAPKVSVRRRSLVSLTARVAAVLLPIIALAGIGYFAGWFGGRVVEDVPTPVVVAVNTVPADVIKGSAVTVEVVEGVQKEITLSDGTEIWVNERSTIVFPEQFEEAERHVYLTGEAFFDVRHDERKPFVVHTSKLQVRVLGTEFNITEYAGSEMTYVALHSGLVEVTDGTGTTRLSSGEKLAYNHASGVMTVEGISALDDWRSDVVYTHDRTLAELFRMIGNYYDVDIVFDASDFVGGDVYDSAFSKEQTAEKVINTLSILSGNFSYSKENGKIIIKKNI